MKKKLLLLLSMFLILSFAVVQTSSAKILDLLLLIDGSGSITLSDFELQLDGYKEAFASGSFYDDYIAPSQYTAVRVSAFQFSSNVIEEIDWTLIEDNDDANDFGNKFTTTTFVYEGYGTNTSDAIDAAIAKFGSSANDRIIDISTDGMPNSPTDALNSANNARDAKIKVNALGVGGVDETFLQELVGLDPVDTPTGIYITANDFTDFAIAIEGKLAREIRDTVPCSGESPEFDTVKCDAKNYFNDKVKDHIVANNFNFDGRLMNYYSDFSDYSIIYVDAAGEVVEIPAEGFYQNAGQEKADPCFPDYTSHLVTAWNGAIFKWNIVLQKKPETDLNITIRDCVLKMNSFEPFGTIGFAGASQTGRYIMPWGQVFWVLSANPTLTAKAYPGEFASYGFETPFTLDGRTLPGLSTVSLESIYYTSKGLWEESIAVVMPEDGVNNLKGERQYRLKQGDMISIEIVVPEAANTVNINYGQDNVAITYVGICGTEYLHDVDCTH